ncbi:MAG: hypothetical protein ABJC79_09375 [Acidimicrobiia bacterium]
MRDPGTPRRNPFFEHGADSTADDLGMGWRADPADPAGAVDDAEMASGGFATLLALVEGLSEAQPDAAEHLVAAAHEVVLTVKVLVDATESVLAQQREAMRERSTLRAEGTRIDDLDPDSSDAADVSFLHRNPES